MAVVGLTLVQVAGRYIFNTSLVWSEELNRLLYVYLILFAAVNALHMRIGLFRDKLRGRLRSAIDFIIMTLSLAILILLIYGAWVMAEFISGDIYIGLKISKKYPYLALVFTGILWAVVIIYRTWVDYRSARSASSNEHQGGPF